MFQHTAARRRLASPLPACCGCSQFQHTAARRRLEPQPKEVVMTTKFQHTAARRRLGSLAVSILQDLSFQHTAARRRLVDRNWCVVPPAEVSTHSRPKAAGLIPELDLIYQRLFQHTAARRRLVITFALFRDIDCFNTQPPEGGWDVPRPA